MIYDKILKEKQRIETQIQTLQSKLKDFPEGKLVCTKNGKYNKWYCSTDSSYTYIPKKEYKLAEKLADVQCDPFKPNSSFFHEVVSYICFCNK